jgi:hypothetical protein
MSLWRSRSDVSVQQYTGVGFTKWTSSPNYLLHKGTWPSVVVVTVFFAMKGEKVL